MLSFLFVEYQRRRTSVISTFFPSNNIAASSSTRGKESSDGTEPSAGTDPYSEPVIQNDHADYTRLIQSDHADYTRNVEAVHVRCVPSLTSDITETILHDDLCHESRNVEAVHVPCVPSLTSDITETILHDDLFVAETIEISDRPSNRVIDPIVGKKQLRLVTPECRFCDVFIASYKKVLECGLLDRKESLCDCRTVECCCTKTLETLTKSRLFSETEVAEVSSVSGAKTWQEGAQDFLIQCEPNQKTRYGLYFIIGLYASLSFIAVSEIRDVGRHTPTLSFHRNIHTHTQARFVVTFPTTQWGRPFAALNTRPPPAHKQAHSA